MRVDENEAGEGQADLIDIVADPERIGRLSPEDVPVLLVQLGSIQAALSARLLVAQRRERTLLTVHEAAQRLNVSVDWLYRHADEVPGCRRLSRKQLRFEARGVDAYIAHREDA